MLKRIVLACIVIGVFVVISRNGQAQSSTWSPVASMTLDRYGASAGVIDGKLYVVSGQSGASGFPTTTFEVYDPSSNRWTLRQPGPLAIAHGTGAAVGARLFIAGGCINADCSVGPTGALQEYDSVIDRWTLRTPMPTVRHLTATGVIAGTLYVAGGNDVGFYVLRTLESYDPQTDRWTPRAPMPTPRVGAFAGVINGIFYVAGGSSNPTFLDVVEAYDPSTDTWSRKAPMPERRYNGASAVVDGILYAIGGATSAASSNGVTSVVAYNPTTDSWTTVAPMSVPRFGLVAGAVNGSVYAAGGVSSQGGLLSTVEAFRPAGSVPPPSPSLISIAVEPSSVTLSAGQSRTFQARGLFSDGSTRILPSGNTGQLWSVQLGQPLAGLPASACSSTEIPGGFSSQVFMADSSGSVHTVWSPNTPVIQVDGQLTAGSVSLTLKCTSTSFAVAPGWITASWTGSRYEGSFSFAGKTGLVVITSSSPPSAQWQSTDPSVATIDAGGNARAIAPGTTTVVASAGGMACRVAYGECGALTVSNTAPRVSVFGSNPVTINEGQMLFVRGSFFDPDPSQPWSGTIDFGDGSGVQPLALNVPGNGATGGFDVTHVFRDNLAGLPTGGAYTVTVTITDGRGGLATTILRTVVNNVPPHVFGPPSASLVVGAVLSSCLSFSDQGTIDAPWTATVDYGDGSGLQTIAAINVPGSCGGPGGAGGPIGAFSLNHVYSRATVPNSLTVTVDVRDKDGGAGGVSFPVTINRASSSASVTSSPASPSTYGQLVTFTAAVKGAPNLAAPSGSVTFTIDGANAGTVSLDATGRASLSASLTANTFGHSISAQYGSNGIGDTNYFSSSASMVQVVLKAASAVSVSPSRNPSSAGTPVSFTAQVTSPAGVPTGSVTFYDGTNEIGSVPLNASGQATLTMASLSNDLHAIAAAYGGDPNFNGSSSSQVAQIVYAYPAGAAGGTFVIGDLNATVGTSATFWGAQWAKRNALSGGPAPSSFKGFAQTTSTKPAIPGGTWTADPANSAPPPATVPTYMAVLVSSAIAPSGSALSGNIPLMVVVKTDPGYASDPGHAGTGTVVARIRP